MKREYIACTATNAACIIASITLDFSAVFTAVATPIAAIVTEVSDDNAVEPTSPITSFNGSHWLMASVTNAKLSSVDFASFVQLVLMSSAESSESLLALLNTALIA